jgi:hypothetical protein
MIPPRRDELEPLWAHHISWLDMIEARDAVGLKHGIEYHEGGRIIFTEWPDVPHEAIVSQFNIQFTSQFITPYLGTNQGEPFYLDGRTGTTSALHPNQMLTLQTFGSRAHANNLILASSPAHAPITISQTASTPRWSRINRFSAGHGQP